MWLRILSVLSIGFDSYLLWGRVGLVGIHAVLCLIQPILFADTQILSIRECHVLQDDARDWVAGEVQQD